MKRIEYKAGELALEQKYGDARLEIKADGSEGVELHIKAYGLAFGNIDSWGDIILPGACDKFLASDEADRMALCWQHERATVIGRITDKGVDDYGMWIEADILPTTAGKDAAILIKSGAVKEFSIGYRATKYHYEKREGYDYDIRILEEIEVLEVSPVTIAANPKAIIVSAKADPNHKPLNTNKNSTMTPEEIKAMRESIEKEINEKISADLKAKIEEIQAKQEKIDAQEKSIENLDKTIKDQQETIKALQDKFKERVKATLFGALKAAVEERKADIEGLIKANSGSLKLEFDFDETKAADITVVDDITRTAWGAALDTTIAGPRATPNAFWDTLTKENVNGLFFNWLEGTYTDATAYVDELAVMADSEAKAEEKTRKMAKFGAHLLLSSEVTDFFTALYDWARNMGQRKLDEFADAEIFAGTGADTNATTQKKVYGLKTQATAFSALGTVPSPTIADVLANAVAQAKKEGYNANVAWVSYADEASFRGIKDTTGDYLYDKATRMLGALRVIPSRQLTAGQVLVADTSVIKVKQRPTYELEIVRNAKQDGWDVYLRKSIQTQVKTPDKKGLIWIASLATAISALTPAQSSTPSQS